MSRFVVDLGQLVSNGWLMNVIMQNRLVFLPHWTKPISATYREDIALNANPAQVWTIIIPMIKDVGGLQISL